MPDLDTHRGSGAEPQRTRMVCCQFEVTATYGDGGLTG